MILSIGSVNAFQVEPMNSKCQLDWEQFRVKV